MEDFTKIKTVRYALKDKMRKNTKRDNSHKTQEAQKQMNKKPEAKLVG